MLFMVGIEGAGHHATNPMLNSIVEHCGYEVDHSNLQFRELVEAKDELALRKFFRMRRRNQTRVVRPAFSFPNKERCRNVHQPLDVKRCGLYDIEFVYRALKKEEMEGRFVYVHRNLISAISSHTGWDNNYRNHTAIMMHYLNHIYSEYLVIQAETPGWWTRIEYDDLQEARKLTEVIYHLADFFGWKNCNMEAIVAQAKGHLHAPRNRTHIFQNGIKRHVERTIPIDPNLAIPPLDLTVLKVPESVYNIAPTAEDEITPDSQSRVLQRSPSNIAEGGQRSSSAKLNTERG